MRGGLLHTGFFFDPVEGRRGLRTLLRVERAPRRVMVLIELHALHWPRAGQARVRVSLLEPVLVDSDEHVGADVRAAAQSR